MPRWMYWNSALPFEKGHSSRVAPRAIDDPHGRVPSL